MINLAFIIAGNTPGAPPPLIYKAAAKRFADTYRQFPAGYEHKLYLINSNGGLTEEVASYFDDIPHEVIVYRGSGWDIGGQQYAAFTMPAEDWIMGLSSWTFFREEGWLRHFGQAIETHGDGLYGATTSFEHIPHVRGTAYLVRCGLMHRYPHGINSREDSWKLEADPKTSLTTWILERGLGAWLVTRTEVVPIADSRKPDNVFRRGDQSNILIYDKHTEVFDKAGAWEKKCLADMADFNIIRDHTAPLPPPPSMLERMLISAGLRRRPKF